MTQATEKRGIYGVHPDYDLSVNLEGFLVVAENHMGNSNHFEATWVAAQKTALLINNIKVLYQDKLGLKLKDCEADLRANVTDLRDLINALAQQESVDERIARIRAKIPQSIPSVTSCTPCVLVDEQTKTMTITFKGNFAPQAESYWANPPQLRIQGKTYAPKTATKNEVVFVIEEADKVTAEKSFFEPELLVSWLSGWNIPGVSRNDAVFKARVKVLPPSPGTLELTIQQYFTKRFTGDRECPAANKAWDILCPAPPTARIITGTVTSAFVHVRGEPRATYVETEDGITFTVNTSKGSGTLSFGYDVHGPGDVVQKQIPLVWGKEISITLEKTDRIKKAVFKAFTGEVFEGKKNPFMRLTDDIVRVVTPQTIPFIQELSPAIDDRKEPATDKKD